MNRLIDLSDYCLRCMVCARPMHKRNTSKDCDRRDNNNNNNEIIIIIIIITMIKCEDLSLRMISNSPQSFFFSN